MSENRGTAYIVNIDVSLEDGGFFILSSNDLPGLCLLGKDPIPLLKQIPELVKKLFELNFGLTVRVVPTSWPTSPKISAADLEQSKTWTAIEEIEGAVA